ncbi:MAG: peptidoglycan DD-metalloendopeptidase family protein [Paludibacteraceae bacterium]|nr:peptidoglycan DD-metalloendopeptidase family protein [Paludibacteraceae bacterium]
MKRLLTYTVLLALSLGMVLAQSVSELQKRKADALKQLEVTNSLINETSKNKAKNITQLNVLNAEIKQQQKLINSINTEISGMNRQMSKLRSEAGRLQKQLDDLKAEYAQLMYHSYFKKNKYENLLFILSADDFSQSYRRWRYMKQYGEYCEKKVNEIKETKTELDEKLKQVEALRLERLQVLKTRQAENDKLKKQKTKQANLVTQLKKKEKNLRAELKKQQQAANKLNKQIEAKIAAEAKKATQKSGGKTYAMTKEEKLVSGNFEKNKGRLPWPVEKGVVVGSFGVQPHPVLKYVTTDNKGIYIQCPKGTKARSVYDGEVTQVFSIPGSNNAVIIKHGMYRTVYANLTKVNVKAGDKVKAKQNIGSIYSDPEDGFKTELYFQVWKDKLLQNPELWLAH